MPLHVVASREAAVTFAREAIEKGWARAAAVDDPRGPQLPTDAVPIPVCATEAGFRAHVLKRPGARCCPAQRSTRQPFERRRPMRVGPQGHRELIEAIAAGDVGRL
ncbi:hypothetical protein [Nocardia asiatica]|uniref:hypothetical protein n=1 Tax=Nocardia asiatica TaxID=209252 RepID=UPI003EDFF4D5